MKHAIALLVLLLSSVPMATFAVDITPQTIKVQGFLSDKSGGTPVPANGSYNMTFDLFDAGTGGLLIDSAGPILVAVTDGLYEVEIPFGAASFQEPDRFLEVTVDGETLAPRIRLVSAPYAYSADRLDGLEAAELDETGEILTHSAAPDAHREHASLEESAEIAAEIGLHAGAADPHPGYLLLSGGTMQGTLVLSPGAGDALVVSAGNVGIGMTPTEALDVAGNVRAAAFIGDGSQLTGLGSSGSGAATPLTDCGVIGAVGPHRLTTNLPGPGGLLTGGDCLILATDGVSLDLSGFVVQGGGTGRGITDDAVPRSGLTVYGGTVTGFALGVDLATSSSAIVEQMRATQNTVVGISVGSGSVLRYNLATGNGDGIIVGCPTNALGNSSWNNLGQDLAYVGPGICTPPLDHNNTSCGPDLGEVCTTGVGQCVRLGVRMCNVDSTGTICSATPGSSGTEVCDGFDNDCNGQIDDSLSPPPCPIQAGVCSGSVQVCAGSSGWQACGLAEYGPNFEASELTCDGLDNDCDSLVDENLLQLCANQEGVCAGSVAACLGGTWPPCGPAEFGVDYEFPELTCDGLDNDCDALTDVGCVSCQAGLEWCSGICRDASSDESHCGGCDQPCAAGQICTGGTCQLTCQAGLTNCGGVCVDRNTDESHCGGCDQPCAAGQICTGGTCQLSCQAGLTNCAGVCVDRNTDEANCGSCSSPCAAGELCNGGACQLSCQAGLTNCAGVCVNLDTDEDNCNTCGNTCSAGQVCLSGTCQ